MGTVLAAGPGADRAHAVPTTWELRNPAPPTRFGAALAYDPVRDRTVAFGGCCVPKDVTLNDTWEWDGLTWTKRTPPVSPKARWGHAMAFDAARGTIVMFGGMGDHEQFADTWEWNGTTWTKLQTSGAPLSRSLHGLAPSPGGGLVLYGGRDRLGVTVTALGRYGDTWLWNGSTATWSQPATAIPGPPARSAHAMVYDAARDRTVVFGGDTEGHRYEDTWEWDGRVWQPTVIGLRAIGYQGPAGREKPAAAYDPARQRVVVYGGCCEAGDTSFDDTWEWDGTTWTTTASADTPYRRWGASMAPAPGGGLVMFGGCCGATNTEPTYAVADTWVRDGTEWTEPAPSRRSGHAMATEGSGRVLLFGGRDDVFYRFLDDTWVREASGWRRLHPAVAPAPRQGAALAADGGRDVVVLFGGYGGTSSLGDTWEWDGAAWIQRAPPSSPAPRSGHAMAYDTARGRVVLFGGAGATGTFGDTWEWDGAAWTQRTPSSSPAPRSGHAMAYDAVRGRVVLYGGNPGGAETWEWDGTSWTLASAAGAPGSRSAASMAFHPGRGHVLLHGGSTSETRTWEWSGTVWSQVTTAAAPPARQGAAMAHHPGSNTMVLVGGRSAVQAPEWWELVGA